MWQRRRTFRLWNIKLRTDKGKTESPIASAVHPEYAAIEPAKIEKS